MGNGLRTFRITLHLYAVRNTSKFEMRLHGCGLCPCANVHVSVWSLNSVRLELSAGAEPAYY